MDIPNPHWLSPCAPNSNQQRFGDALLAAHRFVLIPSAVSRHSWNLILEGAGSTNGFDEINQERFALDPSLQV